METLSICILNPKVKKLLKSLADLDLIEIIPEKIKSKSKNQHIVDDKKRLMKMLKQKINTNY